MTTESAQSQQTWHPPPEGSPCWVEIPAKNIEKLKVSKTPMATLICLFGIF